MRSMHDFFSRPELLSRYFFGFVCLLGIYCNSPSDVFAQSIQADYKQQYQIVSAFKADTKSAAIAICNAGEVEIAPGTGHIGLFQRDLFPTTVNRVFFLNNAALMKWPTGTKPLEIAPLPPMLRSVAFTESTRFEATTFSGQLVFGEITQKDVGFSIPDQQLGSLNVGRAQIDIVIASGFANDSIKKHPIFNKNQDVSGFQGSNTYSGLAYRFVVGESTHDLGTDPKGNMIFPKDGHVQAFWSSPLSRFAFSNISLAFHPDGMLVPHARGLVPPTKMPNRPWETPAPIYAKAILDARTKELVMIHSPNSVLAFGPRFERRARGLTALVRQWVDKGWWIQSIATDQASQKTAILLAAQGTSTSSETSFQRAIILIEDIPSKVSTYTCRKKERNNPGESISLESVFGSAENFDELPVSSNVSEPEYELTLRSEAVAPVFPVRFSEFGAPENRMGFWIMEPGLKEPIGTILFLRGGPASSIHSEPVNELDEQLLNRGYRVLKVEYSGAQDTALDVFERLALDRARALKKDAETIHLFLRSQGFDEPIFVIGASFGGTLASYLIETLGPDLSRAFLIAPAARWRLSDTTTAVKKSADGIERQRVFDFSTLGVPVDASGVDINHWLNQRRQVICNSSKTKVFIGGKDPLVPPEDWQADCHLQGQVTIFPEAGHDLISNPASSDQLIESILKLLNEESQP